jgi:hypothetical protein
MHVSCVKRTNAKIDLAIFDCLHSLTLHKGICLTALSQIDTMSQQEDYFHESWTHLCFHMELSFAYGLMPY